jgi:hypothetical protein
MKKAVLLLVLSLVLLCPALAKTKMPWAPENVIAIHIGPKNATFDESKFSDIKFFYTPNLKYTDKAVTGTPVVLTKWVNKGLRLDEAIVLDKNGNGSFIGFLMRDKRIEDAFSQGDLDSLGNVLKSVVEENRATPHTTDKPLKLDDLSGILGKQLPNIEMENAAGEATDTQTVIYDGKELPTLVYFFRVPPQHKFQSAEEAMKDVETPMQALAGIAGMSASDEHYSIFERLESELYGR